MARQPCGCPDGVGCVESAAPSDAMAVAVLRAAAEALSLQARHGDGPRAVGRDKDLQLRSASPSRANDSEADATA